MRASRRARSASSNFDSGIDSLRHERLEHLDRALPQFDLGERLENLCLGFADIDRIDQGQHIAAFDLGAAQPFFGDQPNSAPHGSGHRSDARLFERYFSAGRNGFRDGPSLHGSHFDSHAVDDVFGSELDSPMMQLALLTVLGTVLQIKGTLGPVQVVLAHWNGIIRLNDLGIFERAIVNAVLSAPGRFAPLVFQIAFDADRFRDAVFLTPVVLRQIFGSEKFVELGNRPAGLMSEKRQPAEEAEHKKRRPQMECPQATIPVSDQESRRGPFSGVPER